MFTGKGCIVNFTVNASNIAGSTALKVGRCAKPPSHQPYRCISNKHRPFSCVLFKPTALLPILDYPWFDNNSEAPDQHLVNGVIKIGKAINEKSKKN